MKFFLNTDSYAYLRGLADEFGESTNAIRLELNHMEEAGLLTTKMNGNKKIYHANNQHPLFDDIRSIVLKHSGITQILDEVISRIGDIHKAWVTGDFAVGINSNCIELVVMGRNIDQHFFQSLIQKVEKLIHRQVNYLIILPEDEAIYIADHEKALLIWKK